VIGVKLDAQSRGGSTYIHGNFRVGTACRISPPRNHFALHEQAAHSVLIAGGIGITPIFSMVQRLIRIGRPWDLYYACRSRADMAFLDDLSGLPTAHLHFDDEHNGAPMDLRDIVTMAPADAHVYCCGPMPLTTAFKQAAAALRPERVHVEYFTPKEAPSLAGEFTVRLARSGRT
jgi:ferredoxin-NADP reductase